MAPTADGGEPIETRRPTGTGGPRALLAMDRRLILRAALALTWARWTLRGRRLGAALRDAMAPAESPGADRLPDTAWQPAADAVLCLSTVRPFRDTCLARSLALRRLLADEGVPARLRIGVAAGTPFAAHAWVECSGTVVGDRADVAERFRPLTAADALAGDLAFGGGPSARRRAGAAPDGHP